MARITINGISLDPQTAIPEISLSGLEANDASWSDYILVQTDAPIDPAQRGQLAELGAQVLSREQTDPPGEAVTYLCEFAPGNLRAVRALPFVVAALVYPRQVKVAPTLLTPEGGVRAARFSAQLAPVTTMAQEPRDVTVVLHPDRNVADALPEIAAATGTDPAELQAGDASVRLRVTPQSLERLAQVDAVHHIEEYVQPKLLNHVALQIMQVAPVHATTTLDGTGEVVAVCDTGFDKGSTMDVHPAFSGRVKTLYAIGRPGNASDTHGHGTHVAGSVLGDGNSAEMGEPVRGSAPGAELVLQSVRDAAGGLIFPARFQDLFREPYVRDGARIHTNSWGAAVAGVYTADSADVDEFVWNNRDCLICFAAGNEGVDGDGNGVVDIGSVNSPGTAKNCLTVGASESERPNYAVAWGVYQAPDFPAAPIAGDPWANDREGMAAFSSRGPTRNRRFKPDVVAPGTAILSARSRKAAVSSYWGVSTDPLYCFMGGTSMATPLVAGAAAVLRQFLRGNGIAKPSAALLKALLINGADDMAGQYSPSETGAVPNVSEGFGRVNLSRTLGRDDKERIVFHDEERRLATGEEQSFPLALAASTRHLKVTLVWTDPAGAALQNDLDLIVRCGGGDCHGNQPPGSPAFDRLNNVEQVEWRNIPPGPVVVTVRAYDVPRYAQSFALVVRTID